MRIPVVQGRILMPDALDLPIRYFGQRGFMATEVLPWVAKPDGTPYETCFDLFAGSASFSAAAMQSSLAENYVINDSFLPIMDFHKAIRQRPDCVSDGYRGTLDELSKSGANYYETALVEFNTEATSPLRKANLLSMLLNCSNAGLPTFNAQRQFAPQLMDELSTLKEETAYSSLPEEVMSYELFKERARNLSQLFKSHQTTFDDKNFTSYNTDNVITDKDIVILDAPYPDPFSKKIYDRPLAVDSFHIELQRFVNKLIEKEIPFILFYGATISAKFLGENETEDYHEARVINGADHYVRVANDKYFEHFYVPNYVELKREKDGSLPYRVMHYKDLPSNGSNGPKNVAEQVVYRDGERSPLSKLGGTGEGRKLSSEAPTEPSTFYRTRSITTAQMLGNPSSSKKTAFFSLATEQKSSLKRRERKEEENVEPEKKRRRQRRNMSDDEEIQLHSCP